MCKNKGCTDCKCKEKKSINQRTKRVWDSFEACSVAEGFCGGEDASIEEKIEAWAFLINIGIVWGLQGWYGRSASNIISSGLIDKDGQINWEMFDKNSG